MWGGWGRGSCGFMMGGGGSDEDGEVAGRVSDGILYKMYLSISYRTPYSCSLYGPTSSSIDSFIHSSTLSLPTS